MVKCVNRVAVRNGETTGGKVLVIKQTADEGPDTSWARLLSDCTRKLGGAEVKKIFIRDGDLGFEVEEIDEIEPGVTLYCSSGEDFIGDRTTTPTPVMLQASGRTLSSLSSSAGSSGSLPCHVIEPR